MTDIATTTPRKRLARLYNHHDRSVISVKYGGGDGILLYDHQRGVGRLGGVPAVEIPHPAPEFVDITEEYQTVEEMAADHRCTLVHHDCGYTYIVPDEYLDDVRIIS